MTFPFLESSQTLSCSQVFYSAYSIRSHPIEYLSGNGILSSVLEHKQRNNLFHPPFSWLPQSVRKHTSAANNNETGLEKIYKLGHLSKPIKQLMFTTCDKILGLCQWLFCPSSAAKVKAWGCHKKTSHGQNQGWCLSIWICNWHHGCWV